MFCSVVYIRVQYSFEVSAVAISGQSVLWIHTGVESSFDFAMDQAARSPKLRAALWEHAMPAPESWPEESSPTLNFAKAFMSLLQKTTGSLDFVGPLGALLATEDEQCQMWLVNLIADLRVGSDEASVQLQVREVELAEEAARARMCSLDSAPDVEASPGSLATFLEHLARRGEASEAAYLAWDLRTALARNLSKVAGQLEGWSRARSEFLEAVSAAASERVAAMDAIASSKRAECEGLRQQSRAQVEELTAELDKLKPASQQLQD